MRTRCRFTECGTVGQMNAAIIDTISGKFELEWCKKCGRIQTQIG